MAKKEFEEIFSERKFVADYVKYDLKNIPTQVFLDGNGKELKRHEGFLPMDEIELFLNKQGLKVEDIASR